MDERIIETMDLTGYEIVGREMFVRKNFWIDFNPVKKDHHIFIPNACMTQLGNSWPLRRADAAGKRSARI